MRFALLPILIALIATFGAPPAAAFSDSELIDGFNRTVYGSEYPNWGWQASMVKKYADPVRVYIDDRSGTGRGKEVAAFVRSLPGLIAGLDIATTSDAALANFRIFVVGRESYRKVVTSEIYDRPSSAFAPGKCLVRVVSSRNGITRSDAVIVADEGDFLFHRCMVEETLQGLGPVNDDSSLAESVFNDRSRHASFTDFDRHLLNMLYDPAILPGMTKAESGRVLPLVAAEVQARLH